ncbi:MAG: glycosyltransferase family 2 protein [Candidatus Zixiibacteriota bacterium]|nr:MAG: glycosyltransferase family 2 protein [candidate division Zixibacteria bacterium]
MTKPVFSIIIPTWNNLEYLKCCVESIRKNSTHIHQVVLHINEGTDGTIQWTRENRIDYSRSETNIGICKACNAAFKLTRASYIVYANDDMYFCPQWDKHILNEIKKYGRDDFFFSATMIEPRETGNPAVIAPHDFGDDPADFQEEKLLARLDELASLKADWWGGCWPPSVMHRNLWQKVGGYSEEYFPGYYSDPDLAMKLWQTGVRNFRGIGRSLVYHFMSKSTGKTNASPKEGYKMFMKKWHIRPGFFYKRYLKMGQSIQPDEQLTEPGGLSLEKLRVKLKMLFR